MKTIQVGDRVKALPSDNPFTPWAFAGMTGTVATVVWKGRRTYFVVKWDHHDARTVVARDMVEREEAS